MTRIFSNMILVAAAVTITACGFDSGTSGKNLAEKLTIQAKDAFSVNLKNEGDLNKDNKDALIDETAKASLGGYYAVEKDEPLIGTYNGTISCFNGKVVKFYEILRQDETMVCNLDCKAGVVNCYGTISSSSSDGGVADTGPKPDGDQPDQKVSDDTGSKSDSTVTKPDTGTGTCGVVAVCSDSVSKAAVNCAVTESITGKAGSCTANVCVLSGLVCNKTHYVTATASGHNSMTLSVVPTSASTSLSFPLVPDGGTVTPGPCHFSQLNSGFVIGVGQQYNNLLSKFPIQIIHTAGKKPVATFQSATTGLKCSISKGISSVSFASNCHDFLIGLAASNDCAKVVTSWSGTLPKECTSVADLTQNIRVHSGGVPAKCTP